MGGRSRRSPPPETHTDKMPVMTLSKYEQEAQKEMEAYFLGPEEGMLGRLSRTLFKPVEVVAERLIPDKVLEVAGNGVENILKGIAQLSSTWPGSRCAGSTSAGAVTYGLTPAHWTCPSHSYL